MFSGAGLPTYYTESPAMGLLLIPITKQSWGRTNTRQPFGSYEHFEHRKKEGKKRGGDYYYTAFIKRYSKLITALYIIKHIKDTIKFKNLQLQ